MKLGEWIERLHGRPRAGADPRAEPAGRGHRGSLASSTVPRLFSTVPEPDGLVPGTAEPVQRVPGAGPGAEDRLAAQAIQIKVQRPAALVDRIIETRFDAPGRRLWQGRLEDQAYVLLALGRAPDAASAVAVARALADPGDVPPSNSPPARAGGTEPQIAGEIATGRLSAEAGERAPRAPAVPARGG